ncbi:bifunctional adenosylcobinamide kinase/adenosylcobinamide-phosphate guanylyltransferase [Paludibacterium paludis]|uniref:Bifunctional adenosylcobalamin biosynthesis protein n=1 Tax=Paludibacterium paludis TaxID=1225769 RepID=A0A918NYN1_9NEIS|nr:bifunctional adenosylcobinamide kinase/adenosylcobinamide-phosphate guanylyltransferase [Paludibacterium paludis]GGY05363.1 bifunctional adenosylcobalamin biosynthesis protein CobP [Paludibacterium paludis]
MVELILGGARSGKSRYALGQALNHAGPVAWIATAEAHDAEMRERIRLHRAERPARWRTLESPLALSQALDAAGDTFTVIDCLTLWVSNWLCTDDGPGWLAERDAFLARLAARRAPLLLVSNEVGFGIVPDNALARHFRDEAGFLHQAVAAVAPRVTLVVAGIPMTVKSPPEGHRQ